MYTIRFRWLLFALLAPGFLPLSAHGVVRTWTGLGTTDNWSTTANWAPAGTPANGDDLVFPAGAARLVNTNNLSGRSFNSISFNGAGGGYILRGNAIALTNGITASHTIELDRIDFDITLGASQTFTSTDLDAVLTVNGDISLGTFTLTANPTGTNNLGGVISGTGGLTKNGGGRLILNGAVDNTFTGVTRVNTGTLQLSRFALVSIMPLVFESRLSIPGDLIVGNGTAGDRVEETFENQIADTSDVSVDEGATLELVDVNDAIGALTLQGATVATGTGTLTLGGNVTSLASATSSVISGHLSLGGVSRTFNINSGLASADLRINAVISAGSTTIFGTAGFTKTGGGSLFLAANNTYNGTTFINDGQVALLADRALGAVVTILGAAAPTVINGDGNLFLSNVQVTNEDLTINSPNPGGAFNASGASVWTGDILLNTNTFMASSGSFLLGGAITGTGGFTKLGLGSMTLAGTNRNTYSGTTTVRDGTLFLDKDTAVVVDGAMSGPLIIGEDEPPENTDVVRYLRGSQLPDDTDITINASGLLDLNGFGENVRNIIFNGGDIDTGAAGSILPIGDITVNANTNSQAVISGRMSLLSNPIINVTGHNFSPDLRIDAQLYGSGGFTKNGVGELSLTASNTFTGTVTVNDGFLEVDDSNALGSTAGRTIVNSGAVLALRFDVHVPGELLTLAGTGQSAFGALSSSFGSNSWAGAVTLSSNATIYVDAGDFLNLSGAITGSFDITKTGTGTLIFSGSGTSSFDDMFVNAGTLIFDKTLANWAGPADLTIGDGSGADIVQWRRSNQLADTTKIHMAGSGRLDLNDMIDTVGAINGFGVIDLGSGTLREGADNNSSIFSGVIIGTGQIFKLGTGTWTLARNNTYSGQTTVSAGTLEINGSQPQSPVTVNGSANLAGVGVIGDLQVFGNLRPGASPGMLTCSNVAFSSLGDYFVEINGPNPGTGYDVLNVRGTTQLGNSTLHVSLNYPPFEGERFTIISNDLTEDVVGTFAGLPNGSVISAGGRDFRVHYNVGNNDVVLVCTNVPARAPFIIVGNPDHDVFVDINECSTYWFGITNLSATPMTGISARLESRTSGVAITQPFSAFQNVPVSGRSTNTFPFQISTMANFLCGADVQVALVLETASHGSFTIPITLQSGHVGTPVRFNNNTALPIPDLGTLNSTINVTGITTPIRRVTVSMHITHTAADDLDISLISPSGITVNLSSDNGGTASDYGTSCADADRTTFSDLGATSIITASAPFVGTFRPETGLFNFNDLVGSDVNGTWTLRVTDDTGGAVGTLRCWSLFISPAACNDAGGPCESCPERTIFGSIGTNSTIQTARVARDLIPSLCGSSKPCPGLVVSGPRFYDAFTFINGESNACITVTLQSEADLFSVAYLDSYNPTNLCQNYLADMGDSTGNGQTNYAFQVSAGARFIVVVNQVNPGDEGSYRLDVTGGSCRPKLNITHLGGTRVLLDWSTSAVDFDLERRSSLAPGGFWTPVFPPMYVQDSRYIATNNVSPNLIRFFRLRQP